MNKLKILCCSFLGFGVTATASAQSIADVLKLSENDLVGSARYMGMGGAFTALGGDISTLSQNPAGIGVYRSSEIVGTAHIGGVDTKTPISGISPFPNRTESDVTNSKFNLGMNNLGYVGTFMTGKSTGLVSFNVGFAFNRQAGEKRVYGISQYGMTNSLGDYIADQTALWGQETGGSPDDLIIPEDIQDYNPYYQSSAPWLSILGYNAYVINDRTAANGDVFYEGLYAEDGLAVGGDLVVEEEYRKDEYTFNIGGNISNRVYWGLGIGVMDIDLKQRFFYDENYWQASNPSSYQNYGYYQLDNFLNTSATGVNVKFGLIARLTDAFRVGASVHTPTWYHLTDHFGANMRSYDVPQVGTDNLLEQDVHTPAEFIDYRLRTPWRYQFGAAYVFGRSAILSFDYERVNYGENQLRDADGNSRPYDANNADIANQLKAQNTFKLGAEFRLTPVVSLRLGYQHKNSAYEDIVRSGGSEFYPSGTIPHYAINDATQYYTGGFGYRFGSMFLDAAIVWKSQKQEGYLFPTVPNPEGGNFITAESTSIHTQNYQLVLTMGYKF